MKIIIGIPAYNEEKNIGKLLASILMQTEEEFSIKKIIVLIDGSTDYTVDEVQKINDERIKVINDHKRVGQSQRINQLLKMISSDIDILVILDSDIVLKNPHTIKNLIEPFKSKKVGLTNGKLIPDSYSTFLKKGIKATLDVYESYLETLNNGSNIFAVKGAIMAISRSFAQTINIPKDVYANDAYLYFSCLKTGLLFKRVKSAQATYHLPSTIGDQINQNTRFVGSRKNLEQYFGKDFIDKEYAKNQFNLYILMLKSCFKDPIHIVPIFIINFYSKFRAKYFKEILKPMWEVVTTSKS